MGCLGGTNPATNGEGGTLAGLCGNVALLTLGGGGLLPPPTRFFSYGKVGSGLRKKSVTPPKKTLSCPYKPGRWVLEGSPEVLVADCRGLGGEAELPWPLGLAELAGQVDDLGRPPGAHGGRGGKSLACGSGRRWPLLAATV